MPLAARRIGRSVRGVMNAVVAVDGNKFNGDVAVWLLAGVVCLTTLTPNIRSISSFYLRGSAATFARLVVLVPPVFRHANLVGGTFAPDDDGRVRRTVDRTTSRDAVVSFRKIDGRILASYRRVRRFNLLSGFVTHVLDSGARANFQHLLCPRIGMNLALKSGVIFVISPWPIAGRHVSFRSGHGFMRQRSRTTAANPECRRKKSIQSSAHVDPRLFDVHPFPNRSEI